MDIPYSPRIMDPSLWENDASFVIDIYNNVCNKYIELRNSLANNKIENRKYLREHEGREFFHLLVSGGRYDSWKRMHKAIKRVRRRNLFSKLRGNS